MQQIISIIKKFKFFLLFLVLEFVALGFTFQYHSYHKSKFVNSANKISGSLLQTISSTKDYFHLKDENEILSEENVFLKNQLSVQKNNKDSNNVSGYFISNGKYKFFSAKVINNNYTNFNNYLTIDKGSKDSLQPGMGVINSKGIVGVIKSVSNNYSSVLSILNSYSKINVRLKKSNHFGTMVWDGVDYSRMQIDDIPRQAKIKRGDTIITGGKSVIFPEGIEIGVITNFSFENNRYQNINIELFNDMSSLRYVNVVKNFERKEQINLEAETTNE